MLKENVYICHSPYQVVISIIKNFNNKQKGDIIICNSIVDWKNLSQKLKPLFANVFTFDEKAVQNEYQKLKIERKIFRKNEMIDLFEKNFDVDLKSYKNIYIYNDWTMMGAYLIDKKIYYHLVEDGLNNFYYIKDNFKGKECFLNPTLKYRVKHFIKKVLNIGYDFFGQSKYVIDIEVNDINKIFIKNKNVLEVPREKLFSNLTNKQRKIIYETFSKEDIPKFDGDKKTLLLLTQPLFVDSFVLSLDDQISIYKSILSKYSDYQVYIKPHPRDDFDYSLINNNFKIIDRFMPIEVLNLVDTMNFDVAITLFSSSIETLNFVNEKIILGMDYIHNYNRVEVNDDKKN